MIGDPNLVNLVHQAAIMAEHSLQRKLRADALATGSGKGFAAGGVVRELHDGVRERVRIAARGQDSAHAIFHLLAGSAEAKPSVPRPDIDLSRHAYFPAYHAHQVV